MLERKSKVVNIQFDKDQCNVCDHDNCVHYYRLELWKHAMSLVLNWRFLLGLGFLIAMANQKG